MRIDDIPELVRNRARARGAEDWLERVPDILAGISRDWSLRVGRAFANGTEAYVAEVTQGDGTPAVLKLAIPGEGDALRNEITALRLADGEGCARLLRCDESRNALLLERLGAPMVDLDLPIRRRHEHLCAAAQRVWRPAPGSGLPTGADNGRWLTDFTTREWEALGRPCTERAVDEALACAARRIAAHDEERAVLVHGDVHQWNALAAGEGFKLVDPDGLLAEAEYDLGILMREDPQELLGGDAHRRARRLAALTGRDATAIWEWGMVERVSTGLLCHRIDLQPEGRQMLTVADRLSALG